MEKKRERVDIIALYKILKGIEKFNRNYLVITGTQVPEDMEEKFRRVCRREIKKYSFPHRSIAVCIKLID